ncbi:MAG TPA: carboxyl transferase domain-containing protein, partial [Candidatus Dormibacteraeota bacterium]|nr:carboxyl transferase domain-containing protein [Candidatus Dormibacteraeota bacterium]
MADALPDESGAPVHDSGDLRARREQVLAGGPERHRRKVREQGKLLPRERIARLFDTGTDFVEDGLFANNADPELPADGVVTGVGVLHGRP